MQFFRWFVYGIALFILGCGGSQKWGTNSRIQVRVLADRPDDLDVVVSPQERPVESTSACGREFANFGCSRFFDTDPMVVEFETTSAASDSPFHVYLRSLRGRRHNDVEVEFRVDDETREVFTVDVDPDETVRIARVFRNSIDTD